jgi:GLPGLI family protein
MKQLNPSYMKRILLIAGILVCILAAHIVWAQAPEGVITYEVKMNMHRRLPPERQEMKAMIPEFRTSKQQLVFRGTESLYKPIIEDEEEDMVASSGGGQMRMVFRMPNTEIYLDHSTANLLTKQEFMGKEYLIVDTLKVSPWKFGSETKVIQGYTCLQAYYTDESTPMGKQEITAWFTTELRPNLGPERFNSLPGTVLAVDINNEERVIVAQKIEMRELKKNELKVPSGGERVSQAEFRKLMREQMEKMRNQGGGVFIRN